MDPETQLKGLDRFLTAIYGEEVQLAGMLDELGFDPVQARWLCEERLPFVAAAFVEAVRRKLTRGSLDLWFRVLNRRFGLDGEPGASADAVAAALNITAAEASQAEADALQKCRYKNTLQEFKKELHRIALDELAQAGELPQAEDVASKLKRLADLHAAVDVARMDYQAKKDLVLKKVQAELDALEMEYEPLLEAAQQNASTLEQEIKNDVLLGGKTVSSDVYQAVYMKGRISWDNDGIGRYAESHPEVLKFRKEGQPSVQIRTVGKA